LSFSYQRSTPERLENLAAIVFGRYAHRCSGYFVDVEGILEDCGLTILPREGELRRLVQGYVASDPRYVIISEPLSSYPPRYRPVVAEELCHVILEYDLLNQGSLPDSAQPHNLIARQHQDIEADAEYLSLAILFPKEKYRNRFAECLKSAPAAIATNRGTLLRYCAETLENDFQVWSLKAAYRGRDLGLISEDECREHFSGRLLL
jgi:Zn-dependent peptidase ImmA (M78 family)